MAEIRSTIDIMMERTRGMAMSSEEKEAVRKEDLTKRARGLRMRLVDGHTTLDEAFANLEAESPEDRDMLVSLLWEDLVDSLPVNKGVFTYLDIMEQLPQGETHRQALKTLRSELKNAQKDQGKDQKKIISREKKKLASAGISGSAVVPKLDMEQLAGESWAVAIEDFRKEVRAG